MIKQGGLPNHSGNLIQNGGFFAHVVKKKYKTKNKNYLFLFGFLDPNFTLYPDFTIRPAKALPKSPVPMTAMVCLAPEVVTGWTFEVPASM